MFPPEWDIKGDHCNSFSEFSIQCLRVFDPTTPPCAAASQLLQLKKGACNYSAEFLTQAASTGWTDEVLVDVFHQGLSSALIEELAARDMLDVLEEGIDLAILVNQRMKERIRYSHRGLHAL